MFIIRIRSRRLITVEALDWVVEPEAESEPEPEADTGSGGADPSPFDFKSMFEKQVVEEDREMMLIIKEFLNRK